MMMEENVGLCFHDPCIIKYRIYLFFPDALPKRVCKMAVFSNAGFEQDLPMT